MPKWLSPWGERGRQKGGGREYSVRDMGTRCNYALFVALCAYRRKIEQQWNKSQMCITGSDFNCLQWRSRWRPGHIVLKAGWFDSLSPPPLSLLRDCYLSNMLSCLDAWMPAYSAPITTTRTSPLIGLLTLFSLSHAMLYLRERRASKKLNSHMSPSHSRKIFSG